MLASYGEPPERGPFELGIIGIEGGIFLAGCSTQAHITPIDHTDRVTMEIARAAGCFATPFDERHIGSSPQKS
jgi:hypothetical protein